MIKKIWNASFGSTPEEFDSAYGLDESVERLRGRTHRFWQAWSKSGVFGTVNLRRVSLVWSVPFVGNSFRPFFRGRFKIVEGRVKLVGCFTMHPLVKIFMTLWVLVLVSIMAAVIRYPFDMASLMGALLIGTCMGLFAFGLVNFGRWLARNEPARITEVIEAALKEDDPELDADAG